MSKFLRTAIIAKGGQSKFRPGIKTAKQLESLERKLALELANPKNQASVDRVQEIRDEMFKLFETEGGEVINEFRQYLETTPTKVGREKIGEDELGKPIYRDKTRVLKTR